MLKSISPFLPDNNVLFNIHGNFIYSDPHCTGQITVMFYVHQRFVNFSYTQNGDIKFMKITSC